MSSLALALDLAKRRWASRRARRCTDSQYSHGSRSEHNSMKRFICQSTEKRVRDHKKLTSVVLV
eukprot:6014331-Pleurochrysis_carterae.AAC.1